MHDKTPPHDLDAELAVIGCALAVPGEVLPLVSDLQPADFFETRHGCAWDALRRLEERGAAVDPISLGSELRTHGDAPRFENADPTAWALGVMSKVGAWQNVSHFAGIVADRATKRKLILMAAEVSARAYGDETAEEVLAVARDGVAGIEVSGCGIGPVMLGDGLPATLETIEGRASGKKPQAVLTGMSNIDDIIGGFKPGQFIIVAGRPGDGKTAFVKDVLQHAGMHGEPAVLFSLEMMFQEIAERVLATETKIPANKLGNGRLDCGEWREVLAAAERVSKSAFWIDDRNLPLHRIVAESRKWHAKHVRSKGRIGIVAVDYIQLVEAAVQRSGAQNREREVAIISRSLKLLAKSLKLPVIGVGQLNRECEKRGGRPVNSDLRESGALEQDADLILFVYRDLEPDDKAGRAKSGPAELIIGKHRGGPVGIASLQWDAPTMRFYSEESRREPPPSWHDRD